MTVAKRSLSKGQELSAPAALSFLKETKGFLNWTPLDMAKSLKISLSDTKKILPTLEMQGYVKSSGGEWITTQQGEEVSGSKPPRYKREAVEQAIAELKKRIGTVNLDRKASYKIAEAVAFGDFMRDQPRVQAADVGIRLVPRGKIDDPESAREHKAEEAFLRQLRAKNAMLHVQPYEKWMGARSNVRLV